jgi:hypothetical protein
MALTGIWLGKNEYLVSDGGRSESIFIMGTADEMADPVNLQELEHFARERVVEGWQKEEPKPHTRDQRQQLAGTLEEINKAHRYWAENNHSRYWGGV